MNNELRIGHMVITGEMRPMTQLESKLFIHTTLIDRHEDRGAAEVKAMGLEQEGAWRLIQNYIKVIVPPQLHITPAVQALLAMMVHKPIDAPMLLSAIITHMSGNDLDTMDAWQFALMFPRGFPTDANIAAAWDECKRIAEQTPDPTHH
jgi:hypothetical protein